MTDSGMLPGRGVPGDDGEGDEDAELGVSGKLVDNCEGGYLGSWEDNAC